MRHARITYVMHIYPWPGIYTTTVIICITGISIPGPNCNPDPNPNAYDHCSGIGNGMSSQEVPPTLNPTLYVQTYVQTLPLSLPGMLTLNPTLYVQTLPCPQTLHGMLTLNPNPYAEPRKNKRTELVL